MRQFGVDDVPELAPRYNIAPTQQILIVRHPWQQPLPSSPADAGCSPHRQYQRSRTFLL